jgi:hypothetical protein
VLPIAALQFDLGLTGKLTRGVLGAAASDGPMAKSGEHASRMLATTLRTDLLAVPLSQMAEAWLEISHEDLAAGLRLAGMPALTNVTPGHGTQTSLTEPTETPRHPSLTW